MERIIEKGQLLIVRGTLGQGLTARGRTMKSPMRQVVSFKHPNNFYSIRLSHISGPLSGIELHFAVAHARKAKRQPICACGAYPYPHNKGKGSCQIK